MPSSSLSLATPHHTWLFLVAPCRARRFYCQPPQSGVGTRLDVNRRHSKSGIDKVNLNVSWTSDSSAPASANTSRAASRRASGANSSTEGDVPPHRSSSLSEGSPRSGRKKKMAAVLMAVKGRQGRPLKTRGRPSGDAAAAAEAASLSKRTSSPLVDRRTAASAVAPVDATHVEDVANGPGVAMDADAKSPAAEPASAATSNPFAAPPKQVATQPATEVETSAAALFPRPVVPQATPVNPFPAPGTGHTASPLSAPPVERGPGPAAGSDASTTAGATADRQPESDSGASAADAAATAVPPGPGEDPTVPEWKKTLQRAKAKRDSLVLTEDETSALVTQQDPAVPADEHSSVQDGPNSVDPSAPVDHETVSEAQLASTPGQPADRPTQQTDGNAEKQTQRQQQGGPVTAVSPDPLVTPAAEEDEAAKSALPGEEREESPTDEPQASKEAVYSQAEVDALVKAAAEAARAAEAAARALSEAQAAAIAPKSAPSKPKSKTTAASAPKKTAGSKTTKKKLQGSRIPRSPKTTRKGGDGTSSIVAGTTRKPKTEAAKRIAAARSSAPRGLVSSKAVSKPGEKKSAGRAATTTKPGTRTSTVSRPTASSAARAKATTATAQAKAKAKAAEDAKKTTPAAGPARKRTTAATGAAGRKTTGTAGARKPRP